MNFSQYMGTDWPEGKTNRWTDKQIDELMSVLRTNRNQLNGLPITAANAIASVQFDLIDAQHALQASQAREQRLYEALVDELKTIGHQGYKASQAIAEYEATQASSHEEQKK